MTGADLPPMDHAARRERLSERLPRAGCDGMLVTNVVNIRYLTGFTGSAGMLLVTPEEWLLVSDSRYGEQAAEQTGNAGVAVRIEITSTRQRDVMGPAAGQLKRLGLEAESVSWAGQRRFAEWFPATELVPTGHVIEGLREVKDVGEIARIEAAAAIADEALEMVVGLLSDGPTEREFAIELDFTMNRLGADGTSFETIVASGPNGARPHARPGDRRVREGDLVVVDFGALVDGYRSDMTRTVLVGAGSQAQQEMIDVVVRSEAAGVGAVGAGVDCSAVDAACRDVIAEAGWAEAFLHSSGHGVGLEIHESPRIAATSEAVLVVGNVVTVEPGVYLSEHGGVRVEDTVVVTGDGCRRLTHAPIRSVVA